MIFIGLVIAKMENVFHVPTVNANIAQAENASTAMARVTADAGFSLGFVHTLQRIWIMLSMRRQRNLSFVQRTWSVFELRQQRYAGME